MAAAVGIFEPYSSIHILCNAVQKLLTRSSCGWYISSKSRPAVKTEFEDYKTEITDKYVNIFCNILDCNKYRSDYEAFALIGFRIF